MSTIERRSNLPYKEFIEKYQNTGTPVILENATDVWASAKIFNPKFFKDKFGDRTMKFGQEEFTVSEILDLTEKSTNENPAPYPVKFDILTQMPELLEYMEPLHLNLATPNWLKAKVLKGKLMNGMDLHIGGAGNHYSVHKDTYHVHAWLIQLYGEKEIIVFPNDQEELLYPGKEGLSRSRSPIDISNPDYEKYPKFKAATPIRAMLKAGEVMYIPSGVWHTTMAYGQNISTIIDQMNSSNYKAWRNDVYSYKAHYNKSRAIADYIAATAIAACCRIGQKLGMRFE
jgi:histone arginine demethylase JMJD6